MASIRVFYAQPVDFVPFVQIKENVERLMNLMKSLPIEIVAPYMDEEHSLISGPLESKLARQIVERDYAVLDTCDIFLADLSRDDRQAIGLIFEMSYAQSNGKMIVVYAGDSSIAHRVWIITVADHICLTWAEVKTCLESYARKET